MKNYALLGLVFLLTVSGVALAHQSEKEEGSFMQEMMQEMMGGEKPSGGMMEMMSRMGQMTEMMDQCTTMMGPDRTPEDQGKEE